MLQKSHFQMTSLQFFFNSNRRFYKDMNASGLEKKSNFELLE